MTVARAIPPANRLMHKPMRIGLKYAHLGDLAIEYDIKNSRIIFIYVLFHI